MSTKATHGSILKYGRETRLERRLVVREPKDSPGRRQCPSCSFKVYMKKDNSLANHRISIGPRKSWPCKGEDAGIL